MEWNVSMSMIDAMERSERGSFVVQCEQEDRRSVCRIKKKMRRWSPFDTKKNSVCVTAQEKEGSVCRIDTNWSVSPVWSVSPQEEFRHVLPMTINKRRLESPMQKKNFPVCQEGLLSVSPSSNNRKFPVCRDGSVGRISRRMSPCKEEVVCRL